MSEFQLTHVALVGARIDAFSPQGFKTRSELNMKRVFPDTAGLKLSDMDTAQFRQHFDQALPLWVHNIVTDREFPGRSKLAMCLRRFEGELRDHRENEVIASVLSSGFRNRPLDPLALPESMPLRQRCAMLMYIDVWQEAYRRMTRELCALLEEQAEVLDQWIATAEPEIDHAIAS
ncbi:hypothetical protein A3709_14210 [Halioglobus sp. HI00S01]|uniref:hypothetical protein n=1 Tax=Halioglobus sp. HI00S01 TaxID=1822214 RepID=UPI0007C4008F|nr:hypothetical protein [Halioglobus sp. HI00S01]KZX59446.1 hypothetical protein A3709_14210 [Halioglobus sp. HI00S01]